MDASKPTTFAGEPTPGGEAFSRLSYGSSVSRRRGFGSKIRDLVDGVYGLFFTGAATKDENARDEMKCPVITLVTVLGGGFLTHYGAGDTDRFATMMALDAAEVRFCNGIGRHEQNSSTVIRMTWGLEDTGLPVCCLPEDSRLGGMGKGGAFRV
jgi:hypothetical protein